MARILIVEDEPPNIEILTRLLTRQKHEVVAASSKESAIAIMTSEPAELVLMDIGIPNVDGDVVNEAGGLEAARWLKSNPATQSVPIIAISAFAMLDEKQRFLQAGCDDVQSKPIDFKLLLDAIKTQLEKQ